MSKNEPDTEIESAYTRFASESTTIAERFTYSNAMPTTPHATPSQSMISMILAITDATPLTLPHLAPITCFMMQPPCCIHCHILHLHNIPKINVCR